MVTVTESCAPAERIENASGDIAPAIASAPAPFSKSRRPVRRAPNDEI
jgi:hypothetical protein